jgi:hypothetical protein
MMMTNDESHFARFEVARSVTIEGRVDSIDSNVRCAYVESHALEGWR